MCSTHLDDKYFVRRRVAQTPKIDRSDSNEDFSTSHDYIVAKIIAYDRLEAYLNFELEKTRLKNQNPHGDYLGILGKFKWTGAKIYLDELIYSLASSGVINNGNCGINELKDFFEKIFDVDLGDIYSGFQDIKIRANPAKFLEILKDVLLRKITEEND